MDPIDVVSAGAAQGLIESVFDAMREDLVAALGVLPTVSYAPVGRLTELVTGGADCDVMVTSESQFAFLVGAGWPDGASRRDLGTVATSIAAKTGSPLPSLEHEEDVIPLLQAAPRIHYSDPGRSTAGAHFAAVLDECGLRAAVEGRLVVHPRGAVSMQALADDPNPGAIGCAQSTEIVAAYGVQLAGALPGKLSLATLYVVCVAAHAAHPVRARRFVDLLGGDRAAPLRRRAGFEV